MVNAFLDFFKNVMLDPSKRNSYYEFEYDDAIMFGTAVSCYGYYLKKSTERKFGELKEYWEVIDPETIESIRNCWRIIYFYKPTAKKVVRYNKRRELKNRLKNRKYLYAKAQSNNYNYLVEEMLSVEEKNFIEREFGSLKYFHKCCRNIDNYTKVQTLLEDFISQEVI